MPRRSLPIAVKTKTAMNTPTMMIAIAWPKFAAAGGGSGKLLVA